MRVGDNAIILLPTDMSRYNLEVNRSGLRDRVGLAKDMYRYNGAECTITRVFTPDGVSDRGIRYTINVDDGLYWWDDHILKPIRCVSFDDIKEVSL